jgi:DNA-binding transcriptional LysR family regulator
VLPSIESLRCFVAAAKLLNFRAASRSVALTPAAFGQRIKQLEDLFGAKLFLRTTRSVQLTEAGLALVPLAERTLQAASECVRVGKHAGLAPMDLVVGTRHELGLSWVLPQVDALTAAMPYLQIHLYFGSGSDLLLRVRSMAIDCAITSSLLAEPKLDAVRLHREDYVFVGAASLLAERPLKAPAHAAHHHLVDTDVSLPLYRYFREAPAGPGQSLRFARVVAMGTIEAIRQRVLSGAGVAVLPLYLVRDDLRSGALRRVFPKVALLHDYFRLVFRADDPRRTIFEAVAAKLAETPLR